MKLTFAFTNNGVPATGLSPVINIWNLAGQLIVNAQSMTELVSGFYTYEFTGYNSTVEYIIQGYESSLPASEQYVSGSNDVDTLLDHERILQILGLVQSNFHMFNQVYDDDGNLTSSSVATYESAADLNSDSNRVATYNMTANYTGGAVTDYKMSKV